MKNAMLLLAVVLTFGIAGQASAISVLGTGTGSLVGNDLTDLGNDGAENVYVNPPVSIPGDLGGFDARFFASSEANFNPNSGGSNSGEGAFNVFDNIVSGGGGKWCCQGVSQAVDGNGQFVGADFSQTLAAGPSTSIVLDRFTMTSSNDSPSRDPDVWSIQGSHDGITWDNIYSYLLNDGGNNAVGVSGLWGTTRNEVLDFSVANGDFGLPIGYDQFRLFVDSTASSNVLALGELELFGTILVIPEPTTATLGLIGLAGLMVRRRRAA